MSSLYQVLGVTRTADDAAIKRAFRKAAFAHHPDRNPDPGSAQRFAEITAAYDVLSDPVKRQAYDSLGTAPAGKGRPPAWSAASPDCRTCKGTGARPATPWAGCESCGGHGRMVASTGFFQFDSSCPECGGKGSVPVDPCPDCGGVGAAARPGFRALPAPQAKRLGGS